MAILHLPAASPLPAGEYAQLWSAFPFLLFMKRWHIFLVSITETFPLLCLGCRQKSQVLGMVTVLWELSSIVNSNFCKNTGWVSQ